jgi:hypothetical protein
MRSKTMYEVVQILLLERKRRESGLPPLKKKKGKLNKLDKIS